MYCNRCGNRVSPESQFCNRCGNKVQTENRPHRARSISTPMVRPARRRLAVEDQFPEEAFIEDYDGIDEADGSVGDDFEDDNYMEVGTGEEVIFSITPTFYEVGKHYALAIVLSVIVMALLGFLQLPLWIGIAFAAVCFIKPIFQHIQHNHTIYKLTTVKIEIRSGLFSKTSRNIPLRHVQDVLVSETIKERLIGVGDVMIDSAAHEGKILMRNIKNPRKYADLILNQLPHWG